MEKRSSRRHPKHALTACGHFTASTHGKIYDGKMLNYSSNGMCIESNAEFKKGAIVMIKVNALSSDADYQKLTEGFRTVSLAEIKWSKASQDADKVIFGMSALKY